jgi:hypothetical protein
VADETHAQVSEVLVDADLALVLKVRGLEGA